MLKWVWQVATWQKLQLPTEVQKPRGMALGIDGKKLLTLQRGVTSTARHGKNITCHGVTSTARHGAHTHSFVYISTT